MFVLGVGMAIYDTLAGAWRHERYDGDAMHGLAPIMRRDGLVGGYRYHDATTDDARLVLRVLREAVAAGGTVVSYAEAVRLERGGGVVTGLVLRDTEGELADVTCAARAVVNATGAFADALRGEVGAPPRMRPLRGSHLVFPLSRFPVKDAIAMQHPVDRRAMFVYPWEGVAIVGTTDLDHHERLADEPAITAAEAAYLMTAIERRFPSLGLTHADVVGTWSGVRPVVSTGKKDPSKETREHAIWDERGLITVTGGKLTTFRLIARDALTVLRARIGIDFRVAPGPVLDRSLVDLDGAVPDDVAQRLVGRHGNDARGLVEAAADGELEPIGGAPFLWAEVRWAVRHEWVVHLDDLLLRRARIGLLLPRGAEAELPRVRAICQSELGWSDERWDDEERRYRDLWARCYAAPERSRVESAARDASARTAAEARGA
jgi:glycerol-3-phosphate dehydrogenase